MAQHSSTWTLTDYSGEKSSVTVYNGAITAVSLPGFLTEFGQMQTAIANISRGVVQQSQWVGDRTLISNDKPTNEDAQRETKWLVTYKGATTEKLFRLEIPCALPTGHLLPEQDKANLASTAMAAFVSRFESFARSPDDDQEAVEVVSIVLVGRNI